jgi:Gram-negative bacterial TonB protein C-terminal
MSHNLLSALVVTVQVTAPPSISPAVTLTIISPIEPENCVLEIRATSDAADAPPTKIKFFNYGRVRIERPLTEDEQTRPTADTLVQLDGDWYAQGRPSLYRIGSPDNDPAKASAPYMAMTMDASFAEFIGAAKTMRFWEHLVEREHFKLAALDRAKIAAWKKCIETLVIVPAAAEPYPAYYPSYYRRQKPLQPVTPINKHSWITSDDYPPRAMREELQGTVAYTLTVNVNGRVQACDMTKNENPTIMTSVNDVPELNIATCRNITRRARFIPATDAEGRPLLANYSGRVRWALPYDPPPPPPTQLPKRF